VLFAVVAAFVVTLFGIERPREREEPQWVFAPASAERLFPWVVGAAATRLPRAIKSVRFERGEVRVVLERAEDDPDAACAPGQLVVRRPTPWGNRPLFPATPIVRRGELEVEWSPCGSPSLTVDPASFADALVRTVPPDAWVRRSPPHVAHGLLTPFLLRTGGAPWLVAALAVAVATAISVLAVPARVPRGHGVPRRWISAAAASLVTLGIALRVHAAARLPFDNDEAWALPSSHELLDATHDAWLHPPLFRVVQEGFVRATGYRVGDSLLHLSHRVQS